VSALYVIVTKMASTPQYKVILLGDPGIGKTTFFLRLRDSTFVDTETRPSASMGVEDLEYRHKIGDTEVVVSALVVSALAA